MVKIIIEANDGEQRLDRFLKKYLSRGSLSYIYKLIRKDVKINGRRGKPDTILAEGDELVIYISDEELKSMQKTKRHTKTKKQFKIVYEDDDVLVVNKPFGLITHGDASEKKNTLANQVIDYLISEGKYIPRLEKTFTPAPANRLDRNTTGLVIFGKTARGLKGINKMLKEGGEIEKYYLALLVGNLKEDVLIKGEISKDREKNQVEVLNLRREPLSEVDDVPSREDKEDATIVRVLRHSKNFTLVEVQLISGRTHQIRAHLAAIGHPIVGDRKYGLKRINDYAMERYNLKGQFLHSYKLVIKDKEIVGPLPENIDDIQREIFGKQEGKNYGRCEKKS